jgi:hypothetical protein
MTFLAWMWKVFAFEVMVVEYILAFRQATYFSNFNGILSFITVNIVSIVKEFSWHDAKVFGM